MQEYGLSFIWTQGWNPNTNVYGALVFIYGTIVTAFIALLLATPLSIAIALFLTELAPKRLAAPIATMVELLAAIPSVVLGLWGILVFGPWIADHLEPWLQSWFGFLPIFSGDPSQAGMLPAALVLTIMIIPITSAICRELFSRVPRDLTDGSLALGSTRWEAIRRVAIPYAAPGISAAVLLGLGRAFGEAIAVTQVIGSGNTINRSLFPPGRHAREPNRQHLPGREQRDRGPVVALPRRDPARDLARHERFRADDREPVSEGAEDVDRMSAAEITNPYDITTTSNNLGRRRRVQKLVSVLALLSAFFAVFILALVLGTVLYKGLSALDLDFLTKSSALFGETGGIADALVGSAVIVGLATIMAVPTAILVAIYIAEYAGPRAASFFRVMLDVLNGVPAIIVGIFIYGLLVVGHGQSAIYGAMALAILMIPMVARATQEVLELVPRHLREASLALGVPRWRTVYSIVLPTAIGGILTGVVIAVARVAGETAPLLFTSSIVTSQGVSVDVHEALPTLPVRIFTLSESPSPADQAAAWAAALVLIAFVLLMNILAKVFAGRKRKKLEGI